MAIAMSTVATVCAVVMVPMLYNYIQYVQYQLQVGNWAKLGKKLAKKLEMDKCRDQTDELVHELVRTESDGGGRLGEGRRRRKRELRKGEGQTRSNGSNTSGGGDGKVHGTASLSGKRWEAG